MHWVEIITMIITTFGGGAGLVALYQARSRKDTIDISNLHSLIDEERKERDILRNEYREYKMEIEARFDKEEKMINELKEQKNDFLMSIYQAYRCPLPETMKDCPVIQSFQGCRDCEPCKQDQTTTN